LVGALGFSASRAGDISSNLVESVLKSELSRRSAQISLAKLGTQWDSVQVIGPYTPASRLPPRLASDPGLVRSRIDRRDDISLLAFSKGEQVSSVVEVSRAVLDLSPLANQIIRRGQCMVVAAAKPPRATAIADCM